MLVRLKFISSQLHCYKCRHPETSSRPTFVDLVSDLSQPDFKLLQTETDTCLGAQLDTVHNLYPELQNIYM